tara:strand:- start:1090 stop:1296 length:207 start_codon:yes stop_codon:yes gene_type:complete
MFERTHYYVNGTIYEDRNPTTLFDTYCRADADMMYKRFEKQGYHYLQINQVPEVFEDDQEYLFFSEEE